MPTFFSFSFFFILQLWVFSAQKLISYETQAGLSSLRLAAALLSRHNIPWEAHQLLVINLMLIGNDGKRRGCLLPPRAHFLVRQIRNGQLCEERRFVLTLSCCCRCYASSLPGERGGGGGCMSLVTRSAFSSVNPPQASLGLPAVNKIHKCVSVCGATTQALSWFVSVLRSLYCGRSSFRKRQKQKLLWEVF